MFDGSFDFYCIKERSSIMSACLGGEGVWAKMLKPLMLRMRVSDKNADAGKQRNVILVVCKCVFQYPTKIFFISFFVPSIV